MCVCVCTADDTSLAIVDDLFRCDWFVTLGYSGSRPSCESATLGNDRRRHDLLQSRLDVVYTYLFFVHGHSVSLAPAMSLTDRRTDRQCGRWTSFAVAIYMQMRRPGSRPGTSLRTPRHTRPPATPPNPCFSAIASPIYRLGQNVSSCTVIDISKARL